jgi:hypothetical protein
MNPSVSVTMSLSNLQAAFTKPRTTTENTSPPPPYSTSQNPTNTSPIQSIKATDVPQWLWSNAQCRAWIATVCEDLLGYSDENAEMIASNFAGFGPRLFSMEIEHWHSLLGKNVVGKNIADAESVYALVFGLRREKGAIPEGTTYTHVHSGKKVEL